MPIEGEVFVVPRCSEVLLILPLRDQVISQARLECCLLTSVYEIFYLFA